jgi:chromosome segregation ATPase
MSEKKSLKKRSGYVSKGDEVVCTNLKNKIAKLEEEIAPYHIQVEQYAASRKAALEEASKLIKEAEVTLKDIHVTCSKCLEHKESLLKAREDLYYQVTELDTQIEAVEIEADNMDTSDNIVSKAKEEYEKVLTMWNEKAKKDLDGRMRRKKNQIEELKEKLKRIEDRMELRRLRQEKNEEIENRPLSAPPTFTFPKETDDPNLIKY